MPNTAGYLYAIKAEGTPYVKVGSTTGPVEKRLKVLQTGQPFPLTMLATVRLDLPVRVIEGHVHALLASHRQHGEWFEITITAEDFQCLVAEASRQFLQRQEHHDVSLSDTGMVDMCLFGRRLAEKRIERGWTQVKLARLAGVDVMTISRVERGTKKGLDVASLFRLARALDTTADYLLGLD